MIPNERIPEFAYRLQRNYHRGFPWFGDDCSSGISPNRQFNPAFKVYALALRDMSFQDGGSFTEFDDYVSQFRSMHHIGDCVNAIAMDGKYNKSIEGEEEATSIYGKIIKIEVDYENMRIRVYLVHGDDMQTTEVYPDTLFNEDYVQESLQRKLRNYQKINENRKKPV